jgi:hypothetical protein
MSLIGQFSRQSALWQKKIPGSEDAFGIPQYEPPETIKCRCVRQSKTHLDSMGAVVTSDHLVMCESEVEVGDKLTVDGVEMKALAQSLNEVIWIDGRQAGRFVRCAKVAT